MNIGEVAARSEVNSKMIRRYEELGILPKARRTSSGYRQYNENDVHILSFVKRSRQLGFSIKDVKQLVGLWRNKNRPSSQVKAIAQKHISELIMKQKEIEVILGTLENLTANCHGDHRPDCPILDELNETGKI